MFTSDINSQSVSVICLLFSSSGFLFLFFFKNFFPCPPAPLPPFSSCLFFLTLAFCLFFFFTTHCIEKSGGWCYASSFSGCERAVNTGCCFLTRYLLRISTLQDMRGLLHTGYNFPSSTSVTVSSFLLSTYPRENSSSLFSPFFSLFLFRVFEFLQYPSDQEAFTAFSEAQYMGLRGVRMTVKDDAVEVVMQALYGVA